MDDEGSPLTPAEKVRFILSDKEDEDGIDYEVDSSLLGHRSMFCQMDMLCHLNDGTTGWKEMARWLKYEEKVEEGDRWSKPHVSTNSLHSLFEMRRSLAEGDTIVLFDVDPSDGGMKEVAGITSVMVQPPLTYGGDSTAWNNWVQTAERVAGAVQAELNLSAKRTGQLMEVLLRPHKHKHRGGSKGKKDKDAEAANESGKKKGLQMKYDLDEMDKKQGQFPGSIKPDALKAYKPNKRFMRKIPGGSEVANILVGQVDFLKEPISVFVRLSNPMHLADLTEVSLPTRFLYIILGPSEGAAMKEFSEQGRSMGTLLTDKIFCEVAYKSRSKEDLLAGLDEFIDDLTVLPPSIWDPNQRLEPPMSARTMSEISQRLDPDHHSKAESFAVHEDASDASLMRTGRLFGGLIDDIKRRYPQYLSDLTDAIHMQTIASIFFMFFACITPIVTFGGLMGDKTEQYMGVMECILSGAICGFIYAIFAGQPLTIVGATGPLLIFESIVFTLCSTYGWNFLTFRFWIGMWCCLILFLMVMFDLSALVRYITRFTEESFAVLISVIFTYEAFHKVFHIWETHPVEVKALRHGENYTCYCIPLENATHDSVVNVPPGPSYDTNSTGPPPTIQARPYVFQDWLNEVAEECLTFTEKINIMPGCINQETCKDHNGTVEGLGCSDQHIAEYVPNVFFLSCFLFLGTFGIAYFLRCFRTMRFFPSIVRSTLADFAVLISILICTSVDIMMAMPTPKLIVPSKFETTNPNRNWLVDPLGMKPSQWWIALLAFVPAALATILIFLDQQITAVIVNRKEHKLKKGHGYHLDLFVLMFLIGICSILGLPWFVAATVRALTHVKSLFKESEVKIPGEKPFHLGVREQRVTGIVIHILIACSILVTNILKFIPMPVLYGVFLYMGITSLGGVQFIDRIGLLFMPVKYQPDFVYLRHVRTHRVHIFTGIQIVCFVGMWVIKQTKSTAIGFPIMLLVLCVARKLMDFFFTQSELYWLDHLLPEATRRLKEDEAKRAELEGRHYNDQEMVKLKTFEAGKPVSESLLDTEKGYGGDIDHKQSNPRKRSLGIIERYNKEQKAKDSTPKDPIAEEV